MLHVTSNVLVWDFRFHLQYFFQISVDTGCKIDISKDLGIPQPLYIRPGLSEFFHPTDHSGRLTMEKSQQIELFCTNGFSSPPGIERNLVSISCAYGDRFYLNTRTYNFNEFTCRKYSNFITERRKSSDCYNGGTLVDIGFRVEERFIKVLTLCHNPAMEQSYYSKYKLTPANIAAQQGFKRPQFVQGDFFPGKDINFLYTRNQQRKTILKIVRSEKKAQNLVQEKGDIFLSRGEGGQNVSNKFPNFTFTIRSSSSSRWFHLCQRTAKHIPLHKCCTTSKWMLFRFLNLQFITIAL